LGEEEAPEDQRLVELLQHQPGHEPQNFHLFVEGAGEDLLDLNYLLQFD
jgi:hypothetical protein